MSTNIANKFTLRAARKSDEVLEPYESKGSRTVPRRERKSNLSDLVDDKIMLKLSTRQMTDICKAFCEEMEKNGYYAMIYCNLNWLETFIKNTVRPSTYRGYEALIRKHIVPSTGHHKIFELNLPILQEFFNSKKRTSVNDKSPAKLSEKTIKNMRNIHTLNTL